MSHFVDVHTHLTHERFAPDQEAVVERATVAGLGAIVVNGLEPKSNDDVLQLAQRYRTIIPACGIYPVDAVNDAVQGTLPWNVESFDVDEEIRRIESWAKAGRIAAVGECGLDGHWLDESTFERQEDVFKSLVRIAMQADIPVIVHSRKLEKRVIEILTQLDTEKVVFHCFLGRTKLALQAAAERGWAFSIPTNAKKNQAFSKLLAELPVHSILTETDAPFLAPERGARNEPCNVVCTVRLLAELRDWTIEQAKELVWSNYLSLFGEK